MREVTLTLVLMALGDALMGGPLTQSLGLPRTSARDTAERLLIEASAGRSDRGGFRCCRVGPS